MESCTTAHRVSLQNHCIAITNHFDHQARNTFISSPNYFCHFLSIHPLAVQFAMTRTSHFPAGCDHRQSHGCHRIRGNWSLLLKSYRVQKANVYYCSAVDPKCKAVRPILQLGVFGGDFLPRLQCRAFEKESQHFLIICRSIFWHCCSEGPRWTALMEWLMSC